jgi:hypothetical protein
MHNINDNDENSQQQQQQQQQQQSRGTFCFATIDTFILTEMLLFIAATF